MSATNQFDAKFFVSQSFAKSGIRIADVCVRDYPEESIVVVRVDEPDMEAAISLANNLDEQLSDRGFRGFVTVKTTKAAARAALRGGRVTSLSDERVSSLVDLLTARSRTTEMQPSLSYVPDVKNNIASATSPRHHLVFGRRGSGKTALLAETKRLVEAGGAATIWLNIHTYRHESAARVFLMVAQRICELVQAHNRTSRQVPRALLPANTLYDRIQAELGAPQPDTTALRRMIPQMQTLIRRYIETTGVSLYIFLDDFHYLDKRQQPQLLDMVHGCVRDCDVWLKVASIQHLTRWFDPRRNLGLQSGHDAAHIDLDITLQNPTPAKVFLEKVLLSYAQHCGIAAISHVFSQSGALDRLVLACGAVPRDYLTLCSSSIRQAQLRQNAKFVGVQDVNKAAGDIKQKKLDELEDDAASAAGESQDALQALQVVRRFCIDERSWTYFRVDVREKETKIEQYSRLQVLTDLRLIHLIDPGVSEEHRAGHRSEVYMLDLSQFAEHRLKRKLSVLDFVDGHFVLKRTGTTITPKIGDTANKRLNLLRRAPLLPLDRLVAPSRGAK
jgi:hypothetical protein